MIESGASSRCAQLEYQIRWREELSFTRKERSLQGADGVQNTRSKELWLQFIIFRTKECKDVSDGMVLLNGPQISGLSLVGQASVTLHGVLGGHCKWMHPLHRAHPSPPSYPLRPEMQSPL